MLESLLPLGIPLLLALVALAESVRVLIGRRHPLRVLHVTLDGTLTLIVLGIVVPLGGVLATVWWVLLGALVLATAIALMRARVAEPSARAMIDGPLPADSAARRTRRTVRRATAPSRWMLGANLVLLLAALALAAWAG